MKQNKMIQTLRNGEKWLVSRFLNHTLLCEIKIIYNQIWMPIGNKISSYIYIYIFIYTHTHTYIIYKPSRKDHMMIRKHNKHGKHMNQEKGCVYNSQISIKAFRDGKTMHLGKAMR